MKKIIPGSLNILAGASMLGMYVYIVSEYPVDNIGWHLPYIVVSVFAFAAGALTFLGKRQLWAAIGLVSTTLVLAYWGVLKLLEYAFLE